MPAITPQIATRATPTAGRDRAGRMGASAGAPLSGRDDELQSLLEVVRLGMGGSPQAVLVQGEAGVGKTTLVRAVVDQARADGAQVLWGQALRFGAVEASYHQLVLALEGWLAGAGDTERAAIIEEMPAAALVLPSLGAAPAGSGSHLMTVVDALIGRVVARGPTVLVVDDVQWADPSTWDALAYLVAGFTRQPFVLLATQRDEQAGPEDFQRWLGSLIRLPGTRELRMERLGRSATGRQVANLLGGEPLSRLVDQVYERSRGNPFFTELLVGRKPPGTTDLPDVVPDELSRALLESWHALGSLAREMTRLLAVAGRPTTVTTLSTVGAGVGIEVVGSLREAVGAGVVVIEGDSVWFRHPLLADVLIESYLPGEAAPVTPRGRSTWPTPAPTGSESCDGSGTWHRTTSGQAPATTPSRRCCGRPTSPRVCGYAARRPSCSSGPSPCGAPGRRTPETTLHTLNSWSGRAVPAISPTVRRTRGGWSAALVISSSPVRIRCGRAPCSFSTTSCPGTSDWSRTPPRVAAMRCCA